MIEYWVDVTKTSVQKSREFWMLVRIELSNRLSDIFHSNEARGRVSGKLVPVGPGGRAYCHRLSAAPLKSLLQTSVAREKLLKIETSGAKTVKVRHCRGLKQPLWATNVPSGNYPGVLIGRFA